MKCISCIRAEQFDEGLGFIALKFWKYACINDTFFKITFKNPDLFNL